MLELEENGSKSTRTPFVAENENSFDEEFLKACDSGPFTIVIYRLRDLKCVFVNTTWSNLTGVKKEECIGKPIYRCRVWKFLDKEQATLLQEKCQREEAFELQLSYRNTWGTWCQAYTMSRVVLFRGERCRMFLAMDIAKPEESAEEKDKLRKSLGLVNEIYSRSVYLNQLLEGTLTEEHVQKQLNEYGINTQESYCCYVVQLVKRDSKQGLDKESSQSVLAWLVEKVDGWLWKYREFVVLLVPVGEGDQTLGSRELQQDFILNLLKAVEKEFPLLNGKAGISGVSGRSFSLKTLFDKAYRALLMHALEQEKDYIHYEELGLYEIAFQLMEDKNTLELVERTIGKIDKYDRSREGNLLETLERILEDESLKMVAKRLFIHHNTVIWRKQRIEKLLGLTLDKFENRALLSLYLKIWRLKATGVHS